MYMYVLVSYGPHNGAQWTRVDCCQVHSRREKIVRGRRKVTYRSGVDTLEIFQNIAVAACAWSESKM